MMKGCTTEIISECLNQDPHLWEKTSNILQGKLVNIIQELSEQEVIQNLNEKIQVLEPEQIIPLQTIINLSLEIQNFCNQYQHNVYQCGVAQVILSHKNMYKIVEMPTGSGKTWIQSIISLYYIKKGQKVIIIEPNEQLRIQTSAFLNDLSHDIEIVSIDQFYDYPSNDQVIIVNEYDAILQQNPFRANIHGITGIWQLLEKNVIFFTAASSKSIEKIIKHIFKEFYILKFQSEYELIKNVSAVSQGIIKTCNSFENVLEKLEEDIEKFYDEKPIIIFSEDNRKAQIIDLIRRRNWIKYCEGSSFDNMKKITAWKYGILFLPPEDGIGINCKFAIDAIVLITNEVLSESQYLQTQGRSSRARGLCESIYYPISNQSPQQIIQNMKNKHIQAIMELERLIKLVWFKRNVKSLQDELESAQQNDDQIHSLKDLETLMGKYKFGKLISNFKF